MLLLLENTFCLPAFIVVLIHFFSSFGELNGNELPLELSHQGVNGGKSMDFARHITFPLTNVDNGAELLPPTVEDNMELKTPKGFANTAMEDNDNLEDVLPIKSGLPKWLQIQMQQQPQETNTASPPRSCSIKVTNEVRGTCQAVGSMPSACVSGDYLDLFSAECL